MAWFVSCDHFVQTKAVVAVYTVTWLGVGWPLVLSSLRTYLLILLAIPQPCHKPIIDRDKDLVLLFVIKSQGQPLVKVLSGSEGSRQPAETLLKLFYS